MTYHTALFLCRCPFIRPASYLVHQILIIHETASNKEWNRSIGVDLTLGTEYRPLCPCAGVVHLSDNDS